MKRFGRRQPSGRKIEGERRTKERDSVSLPGALDTTATRRDVVLIDVSASGARVRGEDLPIIGYYVRLQVEGAALFGTVMWRRSEECGLRFDEKLSEASLQDLKHAHRQARELELLACPIAMRKQLLNGK